MQEVLQFLGDSKIFFLATADGNQPRVRAMGFAMEFDGKLCFCTANTKDMCKQMKANPKIEICASYDGKWVRVAGDATFVTSQAAQEKALEVMPPLKNMYSVGDGVFEIFAITNATATFASMTGESKTVKL